MRRFGALRAGTIALAVIDVVTGHWTSLSLVQHNCDAEAL